jgi:hypothetical protein
MEGKNNQLSDIERPTRVPIIFLMLHESAGFVGALAKFDFKKETEHCR